MPEDVNRHSTLDNYWCYLYERQVKYYKQQTSNMKSLCKTFADRACQLQFVKTFLSTHPCPLEEATHNLSQISKPPVFLTASSVDAAITLKEFLASQAFLSADVQHCLSNGIMLGKYWLLTEQELNGSQSVAATVTVLLSCHAESQIFVLIGFTLPPFLHSLLHNRLQLLRKILPVRSDSATSIQT